MDTDSEPCRRCAIFLNQNSLRGNKRGLCNAQYKFISLFQPRPSGKLPVDDYSSRGNAYGWLFVISEFPEFIIDSKYVYIVNPQLPAFNDRYPVCLNN
jgi:hypothetical protein